jgi:hypothetical protein
VSLLGTLLCLVAAYRLRATPLFAMAAGTACVNVVAVAVAIAMRAGGREPARAVVGLGHVTAALAGFFLFVSFAMPEVPQ